MGPLTEHIGENELEEEEEEKVKLNFTHVAIDTSDANK